jgi:hypothetical protein
MPKTIGYFEGTNPEWLTALVARGHNTLPVSNGYDGHGKNVRLYSSTIRDDLVIGYLHKVISPPGWEASTEEILHGIKTYGIPCLLAVPSALHDNAKALLGDLSSIKLVDPDRMLDEVDKLL